MDETRYLCVEDVVALQDNILSRMGAREAVLIHRDKLESAIFRCRNAAYYEGADVVRQAALLAVGISQAQAFLDGNKRAAFAAVRAFLILNGMNYQGIPIDMAYQIETVAETDRESRNIAMDQFEAWLRDRVVSVL